MKTKLLMFLFFSVSLIVNAQWSQVGSTQFTNFANEADFTFDASGVPYVVYDDAILGTPKVKKFDGNNWVDVGDSSTWGNVDATLLAIAINPVDNQPWVAWKEGNSFIDVYRFDGTNWIDDNPTNLYVPTNNSPLEFVFNSSNQPVIYHHKSGATSSQRDYFRIIKNPTWVGQNVRTGISSSFVATTDKNGESILNELGPTSNSSQIRALDETTNIKFTVAASNVGVKRFNKLSKINYYWVGNDILNSTSGITFGQSSNLSLPQPINTSSNTGNYLKLVERTQGNLMYLMFSDASNQLQIQRYKIGVSQWSELPLLSINTSTSGFFVDIEVNEVDNNLYVLYQDNGRVSMQKFEETPALTKYYVNANVSGGNGSGDSWSNAMTSFSDALGSAEANTSEIWVAAGTYKPGTNRTDSFNIAIDGLNIYGGFNGTESSVLERDILLNPTILSGDLNGDDAGHGTGTRGDNSYHVMQILNADNAVIDGFKIMYGHANGSGTNAYGGAINIGGQTSNLIIKNCDFDENFGLTGGAIRSYLNNDTSMAFENCTFYNNISRYGAGLYFLVNDNATVSLDITNCLFNRNRSEDVGSNTGYTGSSAWIRANGTGSNLTTTITNCTFGGNNDVGSQTSTVKGTLGLSRRTDGNSTHNATINNSIFYFNDVLGGSTGVSINQGHVSFPNTVFVNNSISEDNFSNLSFLTNTSNSNPQFTDAPNFDFTLQPGSPAIDAGDNSLVPSGITSDLLFNQRIHNATVDLGVYEYGAASTLSVDDFELTINDVKVYPNPTSDYINIKSPININTVEVYDMLGKKIIDSKYKTINLKSIPNGVYLVKVITENSIYTKRILKE